MKRKLLAVILTLSVIMSLLPAAAQATKGETFIATTESYVFNKVISTTLVYKVLAEDKTS